MDRYDTLFEKNVFSNKVLYNIYIFIYIYNVIKHYLKYSSSLLIMSNVFLAELFATIIASTVFDTSVATSDENIANKEQNNFGNISAACNDFTNTLYKVRN